MKNNRQSNEMQCPNSSSNCIVSIQDCEVIAGFKKEFEIIRPASQLTIFHSDGTTGIDGDSPADCLNGNSRNNPLIVCSIPNAILMNAGPLWKVYGTIVNSLSVNKGVLNWMYHQADNQF